MKSKLRWLGAFLVYKVFVLFVAFVALRILMDQWPNSFSHFLDLYGRWDTKLFINTATNGYQTDEPNIQNFPLYPSTIWVFHFLLGWLGVTWSWCAFLVAQISTFFAFLYFYRLARLDLQEREARVALGLFAFFPTAYFLTAAYSESIFCAVLFACIFFARTQRFALAAVLALVAVLGKLQALAVIPGMFLMFACRKELRQKRLLVGWGAVGLAASVGLLIYLVINRVVYGDFFYFLESAARTWTVYPTWPFEKLIPLVASYYDRAPDQRLTVVALPVLFMLIAVAGLYPIWRRRDFFDLGFALGCIYLLSTVSWWISHPRYILIIYPLFISTAGWFAAHKLRSASYLVISGGGFIYLWSIFIWGWWAF
jgi:hypothetical protein